MDHLYLPYLLLSTLGHLLSIQSYTTAAIISESNWAITAGNHSGHMTSSQEIHPSWLRHISHDVVLHYDPEGWFMSNPESNSGQDCLLQLILSSRHSQVSQEFSSSVHRCPWERSLLQPGHWEQHEFGICIGLATPLGRLVWEADVHLMFPWVYVQSAQPLCVWCENDDRSLCISPSNKQSVQGEQQLPVSISP